MSDIRIQKTGELDVLQTSDGRLTLSEPIQIKRRNGRKLVNLPNGETAPVRPWDVAPTTIQLALARGHGWLAVASRTIIRTLMKQAWLRIVPALHSLHWGFALQSRLG